MEPEISTIYYINLQKRVDRNQHFLLQCARELIDPSMLQRVEAIDGSTYVFSDAEKAMFSRCDFLGQPFQSKIMGNQLSHYGILKDIVAKGKEYSIVFQDDVVLKDGFMSHVNRLLSALPEDAELVHIGFHAEANYSHFVGWDLAVVNTSHIKHRVNDHVCILKEEGVLPCSLAYIITLRGAKALVEYFEKTGFLRATDFNYIDYLKARGIYYGPCVVLCTGNPALGSDIFT
jgi:GR25 family glycosyltransferase involved in LPS biosynthesis